MNQTVDKKLDLTVNRLPLITWNHLHMNQCNLSLRVPETGAEVKAQTWTPDAPEGQTSDPAVLVHEGHMDLLRTFLKLKPAWGRMLSGCLLRADTPVTFIVCVKVKALSN